jgi:hypothetical protein
MRFISACVDGSQTLASRFLFGDLTPDSARIFGAGGAKIAKQKQMKKEKPSRT